MIRLNLDRVTPGMILSKPVKNIQDMLLLNEYAQLTERNIQILRSWGITEVWVEGNNTLLNPETTSEGIALREQIDKNLILKFSKVMNDPVMLEIMRLAGNQLEKRLLK